MTRGPCPSRPQPAAPARGRCARRALPFALCLAGTLALALPVATAWAADEPIEARERDLVDLEQQVETIGAALTDQNVERAALLTELEGREREVAELAIAGRELDDQVREQTRVAAELRAREDQVQATLAEELKHLSELLRTAYAMGRADGLRLLLNQQDPVRASRVMSYFAYFNRGRVRSLQTVEASARRLARLAREAALESERLKALAVQQASARARLETAKQERAQVLKGLEQTIANREQTLAGLNRDAENLKRLVNQLRQRAQIRAELDIQHAPFAQRQGRLAWPLLEGRLQVGFGAKKVDADLAWDGVLLAAHEGEEVRAVYHGRVVYADWLLGFGMLLVIDHGDGYLSFYGHNEALLKEVGEWVSADEIIALSGNSGGRDEPVLYFAIRRNGEPIDPALWCG
ncbi:peptidoglycan DD-metalloendopeptidase family protein [uncultured Thiodictyon sp.]|uniref:murein hydrolase activator EnvC family protein n=1 Tax=uncultured Thiodictyon sp. TaxID=1846217 RepID=UPI0025D4BDA8|nr:peptidoglycan DD-metalloendopeptidase family protein [uncultured Thiodictyon sp.]